MSSFTIKMIAIITMLIDHIGATLINSDDAHVWRMIGRVSFPLFCFLIVQGFIHTKNVNKYLVRLGIFALISEIPFDLLFYGVPFNFDHQNVFFTLFLGLATLEVLHILHRNLIKKVQEERDTPFDRILFALKQMAVIIGISLVGDLIHADYGSFGVLLILIFFYFRQSKIWLVIAGYFMFYIFKGVFLNTESISLIFMVLYNGKLLPDFMNGMKDNKVIKYIFYAFYPLHMLILYGIRILL